MQKWLNIEYVYKSTVDQYNRIPEQYRYTAVDGPFLLNQIIL